MTLTRRFASVSLGFVPGEEVVRIDLVQELPKLLDFVVLRLRNLDPCLVKDIFGAIDVRSDPKRQSNGVGRTRAHLDAVDQQDGVEGAALELGDVNLGKPMTKRVQGVH